MSSVYLDRLRYYVVNRLESFFFLQFTVTRTGTIPISYFLLTKKEVELTSVGHFVFKKSKAVD